MKYADWLVKKENQLLPPPPTAASNAFTPTHKSLDGTRVMLISDYGSYAEFIDAFGTRKKLRSDEFNKNFTKIK